MLQKELPLSEPEGEDSDFSSYEELSTSSDLETEEVILYNEEGSERRSSSASNYRSWYSSRRRGSKVFNNLSETASIKSKESLTVITENQKNWWYWLKLAIFITTPFVARQLGIIIGKRILSRTFKTAV